MCDLKCDLEIGDGKVENHSFLPEPDLQVLHLAGQSAPLSPAPLKFPVQLGDLVAVTLVLQLQQIVLRLQEFRFVSALQILV